MQKKPASINLYQKNRKSFLDKFIDWALSIGRIVIILTEIIALSAFLYRFSLDRQLVDLHDTIKVQQAILDSQKPQETLYRSIQAKLALAAKTQNQAQSTTQLLLDTKNSATNDFLIKTIAVSQEAIRIDANVLSVSSLATFITKLKTFEQVSSVSLDKIENKTANGIITVTITATLKKTK